MWPTSGIANLKVSLARQLWPLLEKRIEAAIGRKTKGPPIMKAALRAYELAHCRIGAHVDTEASRPSGLMDAQGRSPT